MLGKLTDDIALTADRMSEPSKDPRDDEEAFPRETLKSATTDTACAANISNCSLVSSKNNTSHEMTSRTDKNTKQHTSVKHVEAASFSAPRPKDLYKTVTIFTRPDAIELSPPWSYVDNDVGSVNKLLLIPSDFQVESGDPCCFTDDLHDGVSLQSIYADNDKSISLGLGQVELQLVFKIALHYLCRSSTWASTNYPC